MNIINKVKDYFNNLDKIGVLNLIKWSLLGLALISMIFVDDKFIGVKGTAIVIFAILFDNFSVNTGLTLFFIFSYAFDNKLFTNSILSFVFFKFSY